MDAQPSGTENLRAKVDCAVRHLRRNISAFSPEDLEDMVRHKLMEAKVVPPELRTNFVRYRLGLTE
jgi:hypothetical protein